MISYMLRRVREAIVVMLIVSVVVFVLLHALPGGLIRSQLGLRATPFAVHQLQIQEGLNKPLPVQYGLWLWHAIHGNLGYSYKLNQSVDALLGEAVPRTLALAGTSTVFALALAVPIGLYQGTRRNHVDDYALTAMSFLFYSMPTFFLGLILIIVFTTVLRWLPATGPTSVAPLWTQLANLVLPIGTLTLVSLALFSRYVRSSVVDNLIQDYVRTATAKGASKSRILLRHVLRNAMLPLVTLLGLSLPGILSGALIVEALFNYPGMGLLFWNAAQTDDFPTMLGTTLVVAVAVVVGSMLADILYAVLDPRIRVA